MRRIVVPGAVVAVVAVPLVARALGIDPTGTWWSIVPPVVAITLALLLKDVLTSLFLGVWLGAAIVANGNPAAGFLDTIDTYMRDALANPDHVSIIVFSMLLGGMVGVMSRSGGTLGVVRALEPLATSARRSQVVTWIMGVLIFFDDYANTLIVGNSMRPVTDRLQVSREKLAYLVDSTAAPIACVGLVSTWIGYQVSLVGEGLSGRADLNPFAVFIDSIPFAFYPLFALAIALITAATRRDWGPMHAAERRALGGQLMAADAMPLADYESSGVAPDPDAPQRWYNAGLPMLTVIATTLIGLFVTGYQSAVEAGIADPGVRQMIGHADSFTVLLWASLLGVTVAIVLATTQRILDLRAALEAMVNGLKSMLMAMCVLTLAWSLGAVCDDLNTAEFLARVITGNLAPQLIPVVVFVLAAFVSLATGTSWGTMAIITPLAVPLVLSSAPPAAVNLLLAQTVSAVLGGAVFGDHCSPISDTTVMSSMASGCDHVDHVRTQFPYALLGGLLAIAVGYLPAAAGLSPWISLPAGLAAIVAFNALIARPVDTRT
jgi:Na+/H+ antiporter NhaC